MPFDLDAHLEAMERTVRSGTRDGVATKTVCAARTFDTSPADLWHAITDAQRLGRWFLAVSGDLRRGGRYQLHGNAGGLIEACDPPRRVAVTWEYGGERSWLTLEVVPDGTGARLELEHVAPVPVGTTAGDFWTTYGPSAAGIGWDLGFQGLARHLADPDAPRPDSEEAAAWAVSAEANALYASAARAWAMADVEAGAREPEALAAAERSRAFYAGEEAPERR